MAAVFTILAFDAQNLLGRSGRQAFESDQTDFVRTAGTFETGASSGFKIEIFDDFNTTDPNQGGDSADVFDDGLGARQVLNDAATFTFSGPDGGIRTQTFPSGTQVQAEFELEFANGTQVIGLRLENPLAGQPGEPSLLTVGYAVIGPVPPPGTRLGRITGGDDAGDTPYADIACFVPGTPIETPLGPRPVEDLRPGDPVMTLDRGPRPVVWIGSQTLPVAALLRRPELRPVRVAPGLSLSPAHRVLLAGPAVEMATGLSEALAPARYLGPAQPLAGPVRYLHFACERHEIVRAAGVWVETLLCLPHPAAGLVEAERGGDRRMARPVLRGFEANALRNVPLAA